MKVPRDEHQLELFKDPRREWALKVILALEQNRAKIKNLHDLMQKVLNGEPGYAKPAHVRRMRRRRTMLVLGRTANTKIVTYHPLKACKPHVCWAYTCNDLATGQALTEVS